MRRERSASPDTASGADFAAPHPARRLQTAPPALYWTVIIGMAALTLALGITALQFPTIGGAAIWWPAAGTGVLLVLLYRGPIVVPLGVIAATAAIANILAGRPLEVVAVGVVVLTVEAAVVVAVVGRHGDRARLGSLRALARFLIAAVAGTVTVAILGSLALTVIAGASPGPTAVALTLSHGSALLLMVPIGLVPFFRKPVTLKPLRLAEGVIQFLVTITLAAVIFSPLLPVPMLFTLFPLLAWAAARFRPLYVVVQLAAVALIVPLLTLVLGGPYRDVPGDAQGGLLVQLFMICAAITTLFLAVGRSEREALLDDRERRSALLRGGFIGGQVGFLVARRSPEGGVTFLEANDIGRRMTEDGWLEPVLDVWLQNPALDLTQEVSLSSGRSFQVYASIAGTDVGDEGGMPAAGVQLVEITDSIAARDALARTLERERTAVAELRELARQKDVFVSAVSHELRTPITSILGFAEEIDDTGPAETKQAAEVIIRNSRRLAAMVDQLLELGRSSAVEGVASDACADLCELVDDTVEEQRGIADRAGTTIELVQHDDHEDRSVIVRMEPLALGRVLTNVLSNAIKFTPAGGLVRVSCAISRGRATLYVDDSGMGISAEDRDRVFERFFRSSSGDKLAVPGTGLGLPIVKALVDAAGGAVSIDDSPLGGTRFVITLPLATPSMIAGWATRRERGVSV